MGEQIVTAYQPDHCYYGQTFRFLHSEKHPQPAFRQMCLLPEFSASKRSVNYDTIWREIRGLIGCQYDCARSGLGKVWLMFSLGTEFKKLQCVFQGRAVSNFSVLVSVEDRT